VNIMYDFVFITICSDFILLLLIITLLVFVNDVLKYWHFIALLFLLIIHLWTTIMVTGFQLSH
jgi:hypothetical protein